VKTIELFAKDCCEIQNAVAHSEALLHFETIDDVSLLNLSNHHKDKEPIVYYDFKRKKWFAGRYVGECDFVFKNQKYKLTIEPRFGNKVLIKLFEHIYKVKLPKSYHDIKSNQSVRDIHQLLICIIWINLYSKSAKNGLLKERKFIKEEGNAIKGKFLVRQSYLSVKTRNIVKYEFPEKTINSTANQIIYKAYVILVEKYNLSVSLLPLSIRSYLNELAQIIIHKNISTSDYKKIRYNAIYANYKPLVDFSWDIIQKNSFSSKESLKVNYNFFLDMAEVWENFIKTVLKNRLSYFGWSLIENKILLYKDKLYQRNIIPDIIFKNGDNVLVLDAKYKKMNGDWYDLDREDFYQIHTYSYYFSKVYSNIFAGLIYPLSGEVSYTLRDKNISTIFNAETLGNHFFIEGVEITNEDLLDEKVNRFVGSVNSIIND